MRHAAPPIHRTTLVIDALFAAHPPRWLHRNKKALYEHLCPMLQFLAAGLDRVVFHTFDAAGARPCHDALARLDAMGDISLEAALGRIDAAAFQWGVSDGN